MSVWLLQNMNLYESNSFYKFLLFFFLFICKIPGHNNFFFNFMYDCCFLCSCDALFLAPVQDISDSVLEKVKSSEI